MPGVYSNPNLVINLRDAYKASASAFDAASREWHRNRELKFITSASQSSFY